MPINDTSYVLWIPELGMPWGVLQLMGFQTVDALEDRREAAGQDADSARASPRPPDIHLGLQNILFVKWVL